MRSRATIAKVIDTVEELQEQQRRVVMPRDVQDWSSSEICDALGDMLEDQLGARA